MIRPGIILAAVLCATQVFAAVPVSGRIQHLLFTREQVQTVAAHAYHQEIARLANKGQLDTNLQALQRVRRICSRLIAQAIRLKPAVANWAWEVHTTSSPDTNAHSMAGGKILIGTHFLHSYKLTDNELAVVLAHEIAHVIAEHVREQVSLAASFNKSLPPRARKVADVIEDMQSDLSIYFRLMPLSRLQEMEADDIGIEMAARAGIPPSAVISFYAKLAKDHAGDHSLFNTHGAVAQRIRFTTSMANYAEPVYQAYRARATLPHYQFAVTQR